MEMCATIQVPVLTSLLAVLGEYAHMEAERASWLEEAPDAEAMGSYHDVGHTVATVMPLGYGTLLVNEFGVCTSYSSETVKRAKQAPRRCNEVPLPRIPKVRDSACIRPVRTKAEAKPDRTRTAPKPVTKRPHGTRRLLRRNRVQSAQSASLVVVKMTRTNYKGVSVTREHLVPSGSSMVAKASLNALQNAKDPSEKELNAWFASQAPSVPTFTMDASDGSFLLEAWERRDRVKASHAKVDYAAWVRGARTPLQASFLV